MNGRLLATVVALIALTAPVPAHADGVGYIGTCHIAVVNDTTPGEVLGGPNVWNGEVDILVAASIPGSTVNSASCWVKVGWTGTESKILDASTPLPAPVAAGVGRATYTASLGDAVYICTHVSVDGWPSTDDCAALTVTPACPAQVCGDGGVLDQLTRQLDPLLCSQLVLLAPTVDGLPFGVLYIDPSTGDTHVEGVAAGGIPDPIWECPPYLRIPPHVPESLGGMWAATR